MDADKYFDDATLKKAISTSMNTHLQSLAGERGQKLRDIDVVEFIEQRTDQHIPVTTFRQYRAGERIKLPFFLMMSKLLKKPLASFFGDDFAKHDQALVLDRLGFQVLDFESGELTLLMPNDVASNLNLAEGSARSLKITTANNGSESLRIGSLAIIDTSLKKATVPGNYLVEADGHLRFMSLVTDERPISGNIIGMVADTLG